MGTGASRSPTAAQAAAAAEGDTAEVSEPATREPGDSRARPYAVDGPGAVPPAAALQCVIPAGRRLDKFGVVIDEQLLVSAVATRGAAHQHGIVQGMVLTYAAGVDVRSRADLEAAVPDLLTTGAAEPVTVVFEEESVVVARRIAEIQRAQREELCDAEEAARERVVVGAIVGADALRATHDRVIRAPATASRATLAGDEVGGRQRIAAREIARRDKMRLPCSVSLGAAQLLTQRSHARVRFEVAEQHGREELHKVERDLVWLCKADRAAMEIQSHWRGTCIRLMLRRLRLFAPPVIVLAGAIAGRLAGRVWWRLRRRQPMMAVCAGALAVGAVLTWEVRTDLLCAATTWQSGWIGMWHPCQLYRHVLPLHFRVLVRWALPEYAEAGEYLGGPLDPSAPECTASLTPRRSAQQMPPQLKWVKEWHPAEQKDVFYPEGKRTGAAAEWRLPGGKPQEQAAIIARSCRLFRKGECTEGDACPNTHGVPPAPHLCVPFANGRQVLDLDSEDGGHWWVWGAAALGRLPDWLAHEAPAVQPAAQHGGHGRPGHAAFQRRQSTGRRSLIQGHRRSVAPGAPPSPRRSIAPGAPPSPRRSVAVSESGVSSSNDKCGISELLGRVNNGLSVEHPLFAVQTRRGMRAGATQPRELSQRIAEGDSAFQMQQPRSGMPCVTSGHLPKVKKRRGEEGNLKQHRGDIISDPEGRLTALGGCFCMPCVEGFTQFLNVALPGPRKTAWGIRPGFNFRDCILRAQGSDFMRRELCELWHEYRADPLCPHGDEDRKKVTRVGKGVVFSVVRDRAAQGLGLRFVGASLVIESIVPGGLFDEAGGEDDPAEQYVGWRVAEVNRQPLPEGSTSAEFGKLLPPVGTKIHLLLLPPSAPAR